uniref:Uncharacterized protein n=1 Tax=Romanomermis culicivorax TaxID=13658 RepID=A0A915I6T9_ROMCU
MADVNDYHQNAIVVHDQEKVEITAFAVSKINKSDIFFIATNDSQITIKQEYKIMATKKFLAGAIRSILVDQNEMKHFFIQTEFDLIFSILIFNFEEFSNQSMQLKVQFWIPLHDLQKSC